MSSMSIIRSANHPAPRRRKQNRDSLARPVAPIRFAYFSAGPLCDQSSKTIGVFHAIAFSLLAQRRQLKEDQLFLHPTQRVTRYRWAISKDGRPESGALSGCG